MKKLFTLLISISFISALHAQTLVIYDADGNDVTNGEINLDVHPSVETFTYSFSVENTTDNDLVANSVRYEEDCVSGSGEYYCWTLCLGSEECGTSYMRSMPFGQSISANSPSPVPL